MLKKWTDTFNPLKNTCNFFKTFCKNRQTLNPLSITCNFIKTFCKNWQTLNPLNNTCNFFKTFGKNQQTLNSLQNKNRQTLNSLQNKNRQTLNSLQNTLIFTSLSKKVDKLLLNNTQKISQVCKCLQTHIILFKTIQTISPTKNSHATLSFYI